MLSVSRLFSEDSKNISIGRITLWLMISLSIYFWLARPVLEFPPSLLHMLYLSTGYNLAKKGLRKMSNGGSIFSAELESTIEKIGE